MTDAPHPLLTALARARDDETFARLLRDGGRDLLRDPADIGPVALAALSDEGDLAHAAARLLATALDEARMAEENDLPEGTALLAALGDVIAERDGNVPLTVPERLAMARAFASAGLVPPPLPPTSSQTMRRTAQRRRTWAKSLIPSFATRAMLWVRPMRRCPNCWPGCRRT